MAEAALASGAGDVEALKAAAGLRQDRGEARAELIAKVGENVQVRRMVRAGGSGNQVAAYIHGGRIGVLVETRAAAPTSPAAACTWPR